MANDRADIFISYPSERLTQARQLRQFLASVDCSCWWDKDSLVGGQNWDRARRDAQRQASVILLLCAPETEGRDGVYQREINEAIETFKDYRPDQIYIICLRVEPVELRHELRQLQYIDLFDEGWKQRLARSLKQAFGQRAMPIPTALEVAAAVNDDPAYRIQSVAERLPGGTIGASYVQYELIGSYWDYVNSVLCARVLGDFYGWKRALAHHADGASDWEMHVREYHRRGELVSVMVSQSSYFSGSAHPNHGVATMNFLGSNMGAVELESLFDDAPATLDFLSDYIDLDIRRQTLAMGDQLDLRWLMEMSGWSLFSQFTFNDAGLIIHLSAPAGLPRVFGYIDVIIPWDAIGSQLADEARLLLMASDVR